MASYGTIVTRVYTSQTQIPVQGATIVITQKSGQNRHHVLAVEVSDENGRTKPISIETPEQSASLSPGSQMPFTQVDLWAEAPGFEMLISEDLQVFPNTETLQLLELIPLPEHTPPQSRGEFVQITPQDL